VRNSIVETFDATDEAPDPYLLLGAIKLHLINRRLKSKYPLMTRGDELAYAICTRMQEEVLRG
jgi:hypothetical protein